MFPDFVSSQFTRSEKTAVACGAVVGEANCVDYVAFWPVWAGRVRMRHRLLCGPVRSCQYIAKSVVDGKQLLQPLACKQESRDDTTEVMKKLLDHGQGTILRDSFMRDFWQRLPCEAAKQRREILYMMLRTLTHILEPQESALA